MTGCPQCGSVRVVVVLSERGRSFCPRCGATWVQEGSTQRQVQAESTRREAKPASSDATLLPR